MADIVPFPRKPGKGAKVAKAVRFDRRELEQILSVYFRFVSRGLWKDYAIEQGAGIALFHVLKHTHDRPAYSIAKLPPKASASYAVYEGQRKIRQGATLADVLAVFSKKPQVLG